MPEARARVLLLSYAYPPLAAPESWLVAKSVRSLQLAGADVVVVHASPAWWHSREESLVDYARRAASEVVELHTPAWLPAIQPVSALRRFPDVMVGMHRRARRRLERLDPGSFDAMVTWSQWHSAHLVGLAVKRRHPGLRWLAHFSDPWVENPLQPRGRVALAVNRRMERAVLAGADVVEFTTAEARDLTLSRHGEMPLDRTAVVPHVFDRELYGEAAAPVGDDVVLRYVGSFYGGRRPDGLFAGLAWLLREDRGALDGVTIEIIGGMARDMLDTPTARSLPPGLVAIRSPVPYRSSLELMRSAGALLLVDAPATTNVFLASKLIDYIGAGRPVIGIAPPGTATDLITRLGGWVASPLKPAEVASAVRAGIAAARDATPHWGNPELGESFALRPIGDRRLDLLRP